MNTPMNDLEKKAFYSFCTNTIDTCEDFEHLSIDNNGLVDFHTMWYQHKENLGIVTVTEENLQQL